ncbi:MAG: caspase family protein [Rhizobiaceae bacterium]|nr:caspase family protein [Rhizobiaceae bacterium]
MFCLPVSPQIRRIFILPFVAVMVLLMFVPAQAQRRLALVVGNDAYENITTLKKAANDARGIGDTLTSLGFNVTTATNISRREMNQTLQNFNNSIRPDDIVLFFFAGHGVEIDGENYLLPIDVPDAKGDQLDFIKGETIRLNRVLEDLRARKAKLSLVILDACRNNPFTGSPGRSLGGKKGLARISAPQGTFVMYSADVGEAALDRLGDNDNNPNSIFTRTLIPLMKTPGIDLVDTAREARRQVRKLALSVSHSQTPAYYDAVLGDFYFTPSSGVIVPGTPVDNVKPPEIKLALGDDSTSQNSGERIVSPQPSTVPLPAMVVTAGEKDLIKAWNADNFSLLAELNGEKKLFSTIKLIDKGHSLMVAGKDGSVVSYALPSFKKTNAFYPNFSVSVLTQTTDGTIVVGSNNGLLAAYDGATFNEIWRRKAHDGIVSPILPRKDQVITASHDGAIVTTDVKTGQEISRVHTFSGGKITDIIFINDVTIVAAHEKGEIAYINLSTGRILSVFQAHNGWISSVDVTPDGTAIVTAGVNGNLKYWPLGGTTPIKSIPAHSDVASGAKFLKVLTGGTLASVGFDGALRFWQDNGRQLAELKHGPAILYFDYISRP